MNDLAKAVKNKTPIRNTLPLRCLIEALSDLINAQQAEHKARDSFEGSSWDYFGRSHIEATERAADEFEKRFDEFLVHRLEKILMMENIPIALKTAIENGLLVALQIQQRDEG